MSHLISSVRTRRRLTVPFDRAAKGWTLALVLLAVLAVLLRWQRSGGPVRAAIDPATVVMLGDSLTQEGNWASLLPDHRMANRGYSGFTSSELVPVAAAAARAAPAVVFVLTGTNDIRDGHPPAWTREHLDEILHRFASLSPSTVVVVQTILPRADASAEVVAANDMIRELVDARGVQLLDLYPAFDDGRGALRESETTDGVHLDHAGYLRWRDLVAETLQRLESASR